MLIKAITNPFNEPTKLEDKRLSQFVNDVVRLNYQALYTTKNPYTDLKVFKTFNALSRIIFIYCKKNLNCVTTKSLYKLIDFVLKDNIKDLEIDGKELLFGVLHMMNGLVLKENWVGPSFLSGKANKVLKKELDINYIEKYKISFDGLKELESLLNVSGVEEEEFNQFLFKHVKSEEFLKKDYSHIVDDYLALNGEGYTRQLKLLDLFVLYALCVEYLAEKEEFGKQVEIRLMQARVYNLHTQILENPTTILKDKLINTYKDLLASLRDFLDHGAEIKFFCFVKLEYALIILNYFKYQESKTQILEAMSLLGIEINFIGKLGIRTKYQTFKVPQLTVEINKTNEDSNEESIKEEKGKPTIKKLNEIFDNILHEKPIFDEIGNENKKLSLEEDLVISALIKNLIKSFPMDDMIKEQIRAYLNKAIDNYHNWSILLNHLITRSDIEYSSSKRMERSMIQYEQIVIDWHSKDGSLFERAKYVYFLNFPNLISIVTSFADNYKQTNCYMSAAGLLEDVGLYEEAIECKAIGGNQDQALELLKKLTEKQANTPKMLCVLGDIKKDESFYLKAIKLSDGKYKRAQKSLGRFYFTRGNFTDALVYYKNTVALNEMDLSVWLNMGYIYMVTKDFKSAILCYQKAVFIDNCQSKAWANLCFLYKSEKRYPEAFTAIKEAVKFNERNWQMWYNYLIVARHLNKFSNFVKGCLKVIELNHAEQLEPFIITQFNVLLQSEFELKNKADSFRQIELLVKRLFKKLKESV